MNALVVAQGELQGKRNVAIGGGALVEHPHPGFPGEGRGAGQGRLRKSRQGNGH